MLTFVFYLVLFRRLFLPSAIAGSGNSLSAYTPTDYILLSCGESSNTIADDGRKWSPDERSKFSTSISENASFSARASYQDNSVSQVPYMSARVFHDKFTYSFPVSPGLKFLRFYFYPSKYSDFDGTTSFFSVTANNYLLFNNFSAYLTLSAQVIPSASLIKEFMVPVFETGKLDVTFSPSPNSFAFVNGVEVVSMPNNMYRNHRENPITFINQPSIPFDIPDTTAFETAYRLNVGAATVANLDDTGMFRTWSDDTPYIFGAAVGTTPMPRSDVVLRYTEDTPSYTAPDIVYTTSRTMGSVAKINMRYNLTWLFAIDTGFNYLLRLHFCETQMEVTHLGDRIFDIFINNQTAEHDVDVIYLSGGNSIPVYRDYVLLVPSEAPSEQILWLALHPSGHVAGSNFADAILNGLEIFRLNKSDGSLAVPNPEPIMTPITSNEPHQRSPLRKKRAIIGIALGSTATVLLSLLLSMIFCPKKPPSYYNRRSMERRKDSWLPDKLCQSFTLSDIQEATNNFDDAFIIGRGGFGNVYKGFIKGINSAVAIKRLNSESQQGAREFWAEIQMLSQLRFNNLVSLIGYCNDDHEMILVYDYMANGTLRDQLCNTDDRVPLSWKQRPAVDSKLEFSQIGLARWARKCVENESIGEIIDPFLKGKIAAHCLRIYVNVAENCIRENGFERPTMKDVVERLEFALQLQKIEDAEQISEATDCGTRSQSQAKNQDICKFG
ncbi:hypothetical protein COLO4_08988 [Corchorus olitorius]|uniref:Protein kinase domain-containing protein n=1 Tax=Corchorus olitorius TaxID=93759 RepID=A0A1R3KDQ2_9ROSI|nr:hypothetical protein COLO4_08988 [Corchorus olitorius]